MDNTDIESFSVVIEINDKETQNDGYELITQKPQQILQEITRFMSLNDGDIVMTGTPEAVGVVNPGDRFRGLIKSNDEVLTGQGWIAQ